jgi:RNA polymerase sigma-70 factor (ECF subfamily)
MAVVDLVRRSGVWDPACSTGERRPGADPEGSPPQPLDSRRTQSTTVTPSGERLESNARSRLEEYYERYRAAIYRSCRRLLAIDAEDAVQEVFLRLAENLEAAPPPPEVFFWIQRISRNYCLNEIRNKRRQRRLQDDRLDHCPNAPDREVEILAARDLALHLKSRSPDRVVAAAWLHYVEKLTQKEVAKELGLSRRSIVSYLAEIRERAARVLTSAS